jgi:signal transduction histidine kinase
MRWWLALVFALIAATTAIVVAEVFTQRAESAFRSRAQELAAGTAVAAAADIARATPSASLSDVVASVSVSRKLALFAVDANGVLLTPRSSHGIAFADVPSLTEAIDRVLAGRRFVGTFERGRTLVVGLRLRDAPAVGLIAVALRPDLVAEISILRTEIVPSTLIAIVVGALVGLIVAILIARRLRLIALAAQRIEAGDFETSLRPRFPDEVGQLALLVDRMRERLHESFGLLEAERDRLRLIFTQLEEAVIAVDGDRRIVFANDAAATVLGVSQTQVGEVLSDPWSGFSLHELAGQLLVPGASVVYARVRPDDDHAYAVAGIPASGALALATIVIRDITESERRDRAEREFVANAAHELRTPIAAIGNAIEVLMAGAIEVPEDRDRFVEIIDRQTARLRRLVRALLVLARAQTREEAVRLEPVELRPVFERIVAELVVRDGVRVEISCPDGIAVLGLPEFIEQIVGNLATNASKHVQAGLITLRARRLPADQVAVEIVDTGPGISVPDQRRVFDRFYSSGSERGDREGFGLGLAIVREVARALGGIVELESALGRGTTVRVILAGAVSSTA